MLSSDDIWLEFARISKGRENERIISARRQQADVSNDNMYKVCVQMLNNPYLFMSYLQVISKDKGP